MSAPARRAAPAREHSTFGELPRGRVAWQILDAAALLCLLGLVALAFLPVYDTPWLFVTVLGFGAVGIGIAVLAAHRRLGVGAVAGLALGAWFLLGSALTMPSSALFGVLPNPRTLFGLLVGPVTAWRDMLTLDPPIGETFNLLTVPGLVALLAGLGGMLISLRTRRPTIAWLPPSAGYLVGAVVGAQVAFRPFLVGAAFFVLVLVWTSFRRAVAREQLSGTPGRLRPMRAVFGAGTLALAVLAAGLIAPLAAGSPRQNLRAAMEPPIDIEQYASPLQGFRANITRHRDATLFEVAGARQGDIVRIATLDRYDGMSYRVATLDDTAVEATTFTRVGQWIADETEGVDLDLAVTVRDYTGVWVPTVGRTTRIAFGGPRAIALGENFFYNRSSATGVDAAVLRDGDSYELGARVAARPSDDQIAQSGAGSYALPDVTGVPDELRNLAHTWGDGAPTAGQAALTLEANLRQGFFSHGQDDEVRSLSGHSERRLITLLREPARMIGDGEQYAVAMSLMARELGIPARVIYGYSVGATHNITGDQVGAWAELYLQDLGWVTFDPTPPSTRVLEDDENPQPPQPQPYIENPPPPPARPEVPPPDEQLPVDPGEAPERDTPIDWAQIGAIAALTAIPLLTIVVPIALIVGLKLRRRARRHNDPLLANRIAGAWAELVDKARDIGRSPSVAATRTEQAQALSEDFGEVSSTSDPVALAREADWLVFAPGEPTEHTVTEYWAGADAIRRGMRRSVNWARWLLSYLSTKSFRKVK